MWAEGGAGFDASDFGDRYCGILVNSLFPSLYVQGCGAHGFIVGPATYVTDSS